MSDTLQANAPEARTETGELKNQAAPPLTETPASSTSAPSTPPPTSSSTAPAEDKSLLNQQVPGGAPEKYDFKLPEGTELPKETLETVTGLFKDLNLSQDQGQKLVDFHVAQAANLRQQANASAQAIRESWQAQVKADPDIGPRLPQVRQTIGAALDVLGNAELSKDFREAMDFTGAGDNPAFVKTLYKMAQLITEPRRHVAGAAPSPVGQRQPGDRDRPTPAKALYPNLA